MAHIAPIDLGVPKGKIGACMRSKFFLWSSVFSACFSCVWVLLLAALVIRCKLSDQPFPVLAKFSPFGDHLAATGRMFDAFPALALLALVLSGVAWYQEGSFRFVRPVVMAIGVSILVSILAIVLNPGGYFSWYLS
jgi:hypothetical protein